jgi:hypothetical protein
MHQLCHAYQGALQEAHRGPKQIASYQIGHARETDRNRTVHDIGGKDLKQQIEGIICIMLANHILMERYLGKLLINKGSVW